MDFGLTLLVLPLGALGILGAVMIFLWTTDA